MSPATSNLKKLMNIWKMILKVYVLLFLLQLHKSMLYLDISKEYEKI